MFARLSSCHLQTSIMISVVWFDDFSFRPTALLPITCPIKEWHYISLKSLIDWLFNHLLETNQEPVI